MDQGEQKKTIGSIIIFSILVTSVAVLAPFLGGSPTSFGPGFLLWGAAPLLVAILMRIVMRDWSDAGFKPNFRKNALWFSLVIFTCPILVVITLSMGAAFSATSVSGFSMMTYLQMVLPGLGAFFIFAIFEEFGWRGYLAPKLASIGINSYLGYAITAIIWATWHLTYIRELSWIYSTENLLTFLPRFYLYTFAYSILWNKIRLMTGSVWPVVLLHCLTNAIQHPLAADFLKIAPGMEVFFSFNGLFMIALAGLLGIVINRQVTFGREHALRETTK
jgi:membrane protease YdiL (CAAX protease family)